MIETEYFVNILGSYIVLSIAFVILTGLSIMAEVEKSKNCRNYDLDISILKQILFILIDIIFSLLMLLLLLKYANQDMLKGYLNIYTQDIKYYITHRLWHIIPLVTIIMSFLLFVQVLITGKCNFKYGITVKKLIHINFYILIVCIIPFMIETNLTLIVIIKVSKYIAIIFKKTYIKILNQIKKFDDICTQK